MRYEPASGLADPQDMASWEVSSGPIGAGLVLCQSLEASRAGSVFGLVSVSPGGASGTPGLFQFIRFERDGWASIPTSFVANFVNGRLAQSPQRGEMWAVRNTGTSLTVTRSLPGAESELGRDLYRIPDPMFLIGSYGVGLSDSGRATIWTNEIGLASEFLGTRITVLE